MSAKRHGTISGDWSSKHRSCSRRRWAKMKAVACGVAVALLLLSLPERRAAAAGPAAAVEPDRLIPLLRDGDFRARQRTLDALAANPSALAKYGPVLRQALKDPDRAVRQQAATALAGFGLADKPILKELVRGMG